MPVLNRQNYYTIQGVRPIKILEEGALELLLLTCEAGYAPPIVLDMSEPSRNYLDELKSQVTINDILQVGIMDEPNPVTYYSRIDDISEGKLIIAWPTNGGIRMLLHTDQILDFYFIRQGTPHTFSGLVDETRFEPLPLLTIILSSAVSQIQRRQNFRIKCLIPVEIVCNTKENFPGESESVLKIRTVSNDLSASGISIRFAKKIPEGTLVDIKLSLPDNNPPINIPGRVIYSEYLTENQILHRTGIRYLALSEGERARIVRYVYRTQLQGLRP